MDMPSALQHVINHHDLTSDEMSEVMNIILSGNATDAQIAGLLIALRLKGETTEEIYGAAKTIREYANSVDFDHPHLVDIVGTGGDHSHTFNISTTSLFVIAAAGGKVAKHFSKSVSSTSGSADVLEAAGINYHLTPLQIINSLNALGIGLLFAPNHHTAFKYVTPVRREMKTRTLFNLLGPLTNPAFVKKNVIGVYDKRWLEPFSKVLKLLGCTHSLVVHSQDGMDEITIAAPTDVVELKSGQIAQYTIEPKDFGISLGNVGDIRVKGAKESLSLLQSVLNNEAGPALDIVLLNAGAAIYAADITDTLSKGVEKAREVIANGSAKQKLMDTVQYTQEFSS